MESHPNFLRSIYHTLNGSVCAMPHQTSVVLLLMQSFQTLSFTVFCSPKPCLVHGTFLSATQQSSGLCCLCLLSLILPTMSLYYFCLIDVSFDIFNLFYYIIVFDLFQQNITYFFIQFLYLKIDFIAQNGTLGAKKGGRSTTSAILLPPFIYEIFIYLTGLRYLLFHQMCTVHHQSVKCPYALHL